MIGASDMASRKVSPLVWALALLPSIDCVLNQINTAFEIQIAGLSLLQLVRGFLSCVLLLVLCWNLIRSQSSLTGMHLFGFGGLGVIAIAVTKEMLLTGGLAFPSIGAYGQLAYWLLIGMTVTTVCETKRDAELMLRGLAAGALATALSIVGGYFLGGLNPYEDDNVAASAGWFHTAKTITGVLCTGVVLLLYLGRRSRGWISTALALFCAAACVITYARAGLVALVVVLTGLSLWRLTFGRKGRGQWLTKLVIALLLAGTCVPALTQSESWRSRWEDVGDPDKAGSGRATFWRLAIDAYSRADSAEHIFGLGYEGMAEVLLHDYGEDIKHTHNDFLDSMLVGGFVGMAWLVSWLIYLGVKSLSLSAATPEGVTALAIVAIYLSHAQFTGQLFGTDSMTYYVTALACLFHRESAHREETFRAETLPAFSLA